MTVILSIKPEYAAKIFEGVKQVEYRRRPIKNADKVIVYVTKPVGKVLGNLKLTISSAPIRENYGKKHLKSEESVKRLTLNILKTRLRLLPWR